MLYQDSWNSRSNLQWLHSWLSRSAGNAMPLTGFDRSGRCPWETSRKSSVSKGRLSRFWIAKWIASIGYQWILPWILEMQPTAVQRWGGHDSVPWAILFCYHLLPVATNGPLSWLRFTTTMGQEHLKAGTLSLIMAVLYGNDSATMVTNHYICRVLGFVFIDIHFSYDGTIFEAFGHTVWMFFITHLSLSGHSFPMVNSFQQSTSISKI